MRVVGHIIPIALLTACAPLQDHPYTLATGLEDVAHPERVLVLPMNLTVQLPDVLEQGVPRVAPQVERFLRDCGLEVRRIGLLGARESWSREIEAHSDLGSTDPLRASDRFVESAGRYARGLARQLSVDAVVFPNLVFREGWIRAVTNQVSWDGVERKLEVVGTPPMQQGAVYLQAELRGKAATVSLHLMVFDADGVRVFESLAGLDLVHRVDWDALGSVHGRGQLWVLKHIILDDEAHLREGVELAFSPYIRLPAPP